MIQQARGLTPAAQFPNIGFQEACAEDIPFLHDSSVDVVVAGQAAHWFDYPRLFPEMKRVVREQGTLAFWGYKDHTFVDSPQATEILKHYAYGDRDMLMGPYWSQPGRSIVEDILRPIEPPLEDWKDVNRIEYEPGAQGPRSGTGTMFLNRRIKLGECMDYIRTWSAFHAWQEAHPTAKMRKQGGQGDVVDEMFDAILEAEKGWQGDGWEEREIEIEWGTGLLLARRRE
ncbi:MAG: hypothetical protein Q9220_007166 [cf. Caloplaca sp. 1 TL-2023]